MVHDAISSVFFRYGKKNFFLMDLIFFYKLYNFFFSDIAKK